MKLHRLLLPLVLLAVTVSFSGCGAHTVVPEGAYLMYAGDPDAITLPADRPDAAALYGKTACTPAMLCGRYSLAGGSQAMGAYCEEMEYLELPSATVDKITAIPCTVNGMPEHNFNELSDTGESVPVYMTSLTFRSDRGTQVTKEASCAVDGDTVTFVLAENAQPAADQKTPYTFTDTVLTYTFRVEGMTLTLTKDDKSVTLVSDFLTATPKKLAGDVYLAGETGIGTVYRIHYLWQEDGETFVRCYDKDGNQIKDAFGLFYEDGGFVLGTRTGDEWTVNTYAYYCTTSGGLILTDGDTAYAYTDDLTGAFRRRLRDNLDTGDTGEITEEVIKKRDELVAALIKAFADNGISATIDEQTGELSLDAGFLFGGDSSEITDKGKQMLSKVIKVYMTTVSSDEYRNYVSKIVVEGHTAPVGKSSFESGYPLSKKRADNVTAYILSEQTGLEESERALLSKIVEAVGVSCSRPVYDKAGQVDMAASRRVSFRFMIRTDSAAQK